ncbi:hypothetical protein CFP56_002284 [Quercus suber]|uniref:Uncharacterized protein n=1 Tax=Quercus suber TaxID=58331 RepID=A0AAW0LFM6_QUESU
MAKFSRASSSSSTSTLSMEMEFLVAEDLDFVQVEEQGLSHWEFVNVSDADDSEKENSERVESEEDKDERIGDGFGSLGDDFDDELVPWDVSGKFGRQRMRKIGKRAFPKMYNSKRSPYLFVRPGCVRGKHGMGMKHNC